MENIILLLVFACMAVIVYSLMTLAKLDYVEENPEFKRNSDLLSYSIDEIEKINKQTEEILDKYKIEYEHLKN